MAASTTTDANVGLPLKSFNKSTPPGWTTGDPTYPLRQYAQLLRLWWRQTDLPETAAGPAMAGRLHGTAQQYALSLKRDRLDLDTGLRREMQGDELLAQSSHPEWTDAGGTVHPAEPAGGAILLTALQDPVVGFGTHAQDMSISSLESFFTLERGNKKHVRVRPALEPLF